MRLVFAAAEELKVPLPFASILRDRFLDLAAHGGENLDWSAIGILAAKDAAFLPEKEKSKSIHRSHLLPVPAAITRIRNVRGVL